LETDQQNKVKLVASVHLHAAVITHESFHIKMMMDGFPVRHRGMVFSDSGHAFKTLGNLISHTVFFEAFLAMGFDRQQFFFDASNIDDLHGMWTEIEPLLKMPNRSRFVRGYWNSQYIAQWLSRHMGFQNDVELAIEIGRKNFPNFDTDAEWIVAWFGRGQYKNPERYAECVNELMGAIGFDPIEFAEVHRVNGHIELI
jgi:hypothetical protein